MLMELPAKWSGCSRTIPLEGFSGVLAHWGDLIAVGVKSDVVLLDAVTGIRTSVLSGDTDTISSLGFSRDGTLLVSHSNNGPVKLWDVQTGGVISTFDCGASGSVASISPDGTTIAFGTDSGTIHLWDVRTGKRHSIEAGQDNSVNHIRFSPVDSQRFISSSFDGTIQQWNVAGQQIGFPYEEGGEDLAYALDGTRFISCWGSIATVRDSESGAVVVEIKVPVSGLPSRCCFSPDGRFVALSVGETIYVWDITIPGARLVGRLAGHTGHITSITFPSYLISASNDKSVKFWQSSSFLAESKSTDHITALQGSTRVMSVNLFTEDGTVITSDESGVVKTWDLITGRYKSSFSTLAKGPRDACMADNAFCLVWLEGFKRQYHIWDVGKGQLLRRCRSSFYRAEDVGVSGGMEGWANPLIFDPHSSFYSIGGVNFDVKISGDGSKIFGVRGKQVEVVSMRTGEITSRLDIMVGWEGPFGLCVRGSQVGIDNLCRQGWDFGGGKASDFGLLSNHFRLDLADPAPECRQYVDRIVDTMTGRRVFCLPERYIDPSMKVIWDGQYLLIWSSSGEIVVVNFDYVVQILPTALSALV